MLKQTIAVAVFLIAAVVFCEAATINANSCAQTAVQAAVNSANDGDIVMVPSGSCTWSSSVSISGKTIVLQGAGRQNTIISYGGSGHSLLTLSPGSKRGRMEVAGFRFQGGDSNYWSGMHISFSGPSGWGNLRIHDNTFANTGGNNAIRGSSATNGVIDSNIFEGTLHCIQLDGAGQSDWSGSINYGGPNFFFIENNLFDLSDNYGSTGRFAVDIMNGGNLVFRHNILKNGFVENHDKCRSSLPSSRAFEIYGNQFTKDSTGWKAIDLSCGEGVVYDNTISSSWSIAIGAYDSREGTCSLPAIEILGASTPVYIWGNTHGGSSKNNVVCTSSASACARMKFMEGQQRPGYTPYIYPHPIVTGSNSQTCSQVQGTCCATGQTCSGTTKTASDCSTCCAGTCQAAQQCTNECSTNGARQCLSSTSYQTCGNHDSDSCLEWSSATNCAAGQACSNGNCQQSQACIAGDLNCDKKVDIFDLVLVAQNYGKTSGFDTKADANKDGKIDIFDLVVVAQNYGKSGTADTKPPTRTNSQPSGSLPAGTASTTISLTTDEAATCKHSTTAGVAYSAMTGSFTTTGATTHSKSVTGLSNGNTYSFYVRCVDNAGNANTDDYQITFSVASGGSGSTTLPSGNNGIAASYPGDANIQSDPNVIFADGFETYSSASQLTGTGRWSNYYQQSYTRIATESANVYSGSKSLEFTLPQTGSEIANEVSKKLSQGEDTLFVRVYTKFESGFSVDGQGHNGPVIKAKYPGPGNIPNGRDFFLVALENTAYLNEAQPGYTHNYVYHPEQRSQWGDHWYGDGTVIPYSSTPGDFGPNFVKRQHHLSQTNRWYSYELMVKANTPGQRDGRVAVWIDGNLIADFQNVRLRDVNTLKMDEFGLNLHCQSSSRSNKKWYDNVVVARSYIGPMVQ